MKLYKYKSLDNLWYLLDMLVFNRLYCAHWSELNDPLEGRYEIYLGEKSSTIETSMVGRIEEARDSYRISSLSADATNFLLWSHYAAGHKGIAIEVDIPQDDPNLCQVTYSPFVSLFTDKLQTKEDMRHLFNGKSEEWEYEKEYRIICEEKFFRLPTPIERVFIGPMVDDQRLAILRAVIPTKIEVVKTELDRAQGVLTVVPPNSALQSTAQAALKPDR
jgi:Protein of unknown function (DUF2971)